MRRALWLVGAAVLTLVLCAPGCGRGETGEAPPAREPGPVRVVVSVPPLEGLCRALLPEDAEVRVLVKPGQSPHGFEPSPSDIAAVSKADLVVLVGMGIEAGLPESVREGDRVVSMAGVLGMGDGAEGDAGSGDAGKGDGHGDHGHGEGGADPHLWLDPGLVGAFVPELGERVRRAMRRAGAPEAEVERVTRRADDFLREVEGVDRSYREALAGLQGDAIITQHDGWSRLAGRYGLVIAGVIQVAHEGEPTPGHIAEVVAAAKRDHARAVFAEAQLDATLAERVAEQIGVPVGRLDPLGDGDWAAMMRANLKELAGTIAKDQPGVGGEGQEGAG